MSYEINTTESDCYKGSTCLINKLNIRDKVILAKIEADITFAKAAQLESKGLNEEFSTAYYKSIHKYLFEDLYDWAGCFRKINISKKGTRFADWKELNELCDKLFLRLKGLNYLKGLSLQEFVNEITDVYCSLNMLHPFREGNGRTERILISQLVRYNGYTIDFSKIDKDLLLLATIQSAQGVTDNLKSIIFDAVK